MSYAQFKPTFWAEEIMRDLEMLEVFAADCNRDYEGTIKQRGEQVKINGIGKPSVYTLDPNNAGADIPDPETLPDTSIFLPVKQVSLFNFMVPDLDEAQARGNIMSAAFKEATEQLNNAMDTYISKQVLDPTVPKMYSTPEVVTESNVLSILDKAQVKLFENNVSPSTMVTVTISPRFYELFRRAYQKLDTNNSNFLKNGWIANYNGLTIRMSNNVTTSSSGTIDNIMIRTKRAVSFVNPLTKTEAYRPEKKFSDAVKGFTLYDAKVVRPKEIFNINVKYS